jgi:RNA polymerase sigma factor (sigma-70 family)
MPHFFNSSSGGLQRPVDSPGGATSALTDQEDPSLRLIDKIKAGVDVEENSRKLYELHYRKVIGFFRKKGCSSEESRDLTQEVFSRVFQKIDTFRRESRFERWLFEIAANAFRNELRWKGAEKRDAVELSIDVPPDDEGAPGAREPVSEGRGALEAMIERERKGALLSELQALPPQMRTCCLLRYVRGLKYQEIAKVMKISIETVKAHLHQARKRLIEKLGDGGKGGS